MGMATRGGKGIQSCNRAGTGEGHRAPVAEDSISNPANPRMSGMNLLKMIWEPSMEGRQKCGIDPHEGALYRA